MTTLQKQTTHLFKDEPNCITPNTSNSTNGRLVFLCIYACCALLFTVVYFVITKDYERSTIGDLTTFKAAKPFQYRVLTPAIAWIIHLLVPVKLRAVYALITAISTFALLVAFRNYLALFLPRKAASGLALAILYPLFWNYCAFGLFYFPWDIPAVAFFVIGLILIYKRQMALYYPLFLVATLNRETTCFLAIAYVLVMAGKEKPGKTVLHVAAQAAIWLAIKWAITFTFAANPGANVVEIMLQHNIIFLHQLLHMQFDAIKLILTFGMLWLAIPLVWKHQPQFTKRLLWVCVPFLAVSAITANLYEVRVYSELIPVLLTPVILSVYRVVCDKAISYAD